MKEIRQVGYDNVVCLYTSMVMTIHVKMLRLERSIPASLVNHRGTIMTM